ncbi:MAG: hypothetical protein WAT66_13145 [Actinomycetota bacterium]
MRVARAAAAALVLAVATTACQVDVAVRATIARDGSGDFSLRFDVDKELIDLAGRTGQNPFATLGELDADLRAKGWRVTRSTPGGGLSVAIDRHFTSPKDLNGALAALESQPSGPAQGFFHVTVGRSSSFFRTKTSFQGTIDLATDRLLSESDLPEATKNTLRPIVEEAAGEFLTFTVRVALPGKASSSSGVPKRVSGGTVTWTPSLGKRVTLTASSSAYNPVGYAVIGAPLVLLLALTVRRFVRRRTTRPAATGEPL